MKITINSLYEWVDIDGPPKIERVLGERESKIATINILDPKAMPVVSDKSELTENLEVGAIRLLTSDPFSKTNILEDDIPEKHKSRRDRAWKDIKELTEADYLWDKKLRWKLIKATAEKTGRIHTEIYTLLRRYWQGGLIPNALLPRYGRINKTKRDGAKPGRKGILTGIAIGPAQKKKFHLGIKSFYEKAKKPSLQEAYRQTLLRYFNSGYEMQDGKTIPVLPPKDELPTMRQFRYWYENNRNPERALKIREGKKFNLLHREIKGDSTSMSFGPGSLYQIDSTVGDIYLVSTMNRNIIVGRPTLYLICDVFTRCIVGYNLTLEEPSHQQAAVALENAISNKVEFCKTLGFDISEEDWPCQGVPECLVADRGELKGTIANQIILGLGIRLDNTPPYRADLKGIVERHFQIGNTRLFHILPGAVQRTKERGDIDPRLHAKLDIQQLNKLVLGWILDHNLRALEQYPAKEFQIEEGVELIPSSLWEWGIARSSGTLKQLSPEVVKTHLLPQGEAGITPKGIHFKKAYYTCSKAIEEQWFLRAREGKPKKVKVAYDPRDASVLYVRTTEGIEKCQLKEISQQFEKRTWAEIQAWLLDQRKKGLENEGENLQKETKFRSQIDEAVKNAEAMFEPDGQTKTARLKNIRSNRKEEAARQKLIQPLPEEPEQVEDPTYIGPPSYIKLLRKQQEERK